MRPILGIVCDTRPIGSETGQAVVNRYVEAAMRHAEADALLIPSLPHLLNAANVIARLDGVLLTGSPSNVAPSRYGDGRPGQGPFDPARDETVLALIDAAAAHARPVFGVCRGFQELNVALGGTLRRDLGTGDHPHHAAEGVAFAGMFDHRHQVALTPGGLLARAHGREALTVNSVHFQGVDRLADDLTVEARAPDGVIEAVSVERGGAPVLAVQWHPEWDTANDPEARTFFHLLGRALRGATLKELGRA